MGQRFPPKNYLGGCPAGGKKARGIFVTKLSGNDFAKMVKFIYHPSVASRLGETSGMIVNDKLVEEVKRIFDLNLYESRLWLAMLSRGVSTAGELSEISSVPRSRTYDILESLKKKGLINVRKETRPVKYIAISPREAVDQVKKNYHKKVDELSNFMEDLKKTEVVGKLSGLHLTGSQLVEKHDMSGLLKSRQSATHHLGKLFRNAKKDIEMLLTPHELGFILKSQGDNLEKAAKRGVDIKIAGPFTDKEKAAVKQLRTFAKVKVVKEISARIVMVDQKEAIFSLFPSKEVHNLFDVAVWIESPYFTKAMSSMLNHVWDSAHA